MAYERKTHTPETFTKALYDCLANDYRKKTLRRRQLQELLMDMRACNQRHQFRLMTLSEAWKQFDLSQSKWWLRRVFIARDMRGHQAIFDNIEDVAISLRTPREKYRVTDKRRLAAIRAWFRPDGTLLKTWRA